MLFGWGAGLGQGYAARFYDVAPLAGYARPIAEVGRFCLAPGGVHPDVLRLAWGAMTRLVDEGQAGLMVGCSSFRGADWRQHRAALALLAESHLGPKDHRPGRKAAEVVDFPTLAGPVTDRRAALAGLPPLLRTYLGMGGWVSDHAVVDRELDTLHVFTCVEVDRVPAARAGSLRKVAG
jgi:putative hemolysin